MGNCPGCGTQTNGLSIQEPQIGGVRYIENPWCGPCSKQKVVDARVALSVCHCSQVEGPHTHG